MSDYPDFEDLKDGGGECEDHFYIVAQRLLDAIRKVEAKLDAMENRLLPPGYAFVHKTDITTANHPSCGNLYNLETEPR